MNNSGRRIDADGRWRALRRRHLPSSIVHLSSSLCSKHTVRYLALLLPMWATIGACADRRGPTTRPLSARERQEQALRDPFTYGTDEEHPTVSGGGKKGIKRDLQRFFDP